MQQLDRHSVGSSLNNVHPVKRKRKVRANIILHIRRERPSERNGTTKQNPPKNVSDNWNSKRKIKGGRRKKSWSDDPCTIPTRPKYILLERPPKEEKKKEQEKPKRNEFVISLQGNIRIRRYNNKQKIYIRWVRCTYTFFLPPFHLNAMAQYQQVNVYTCACVVEIKEQQNHSLLGRNGYFTYIPKRPPPPRFFVAILF